SGRPLKTTPIYTDLLATGAVMGQVYGWERPLWFAPNGEQDEPSFERPNWWQQVGEEARALASACGLSEMSTYATFCVEGHDAEAFLDFIGSARCPSAPGKVGLTLMLNARGGMVGDLTVENCGDGQFYCVGATLAVARYQRWLQQHADGFGVCITDTTDETAILGIAGPRSRRLLNALSQGAFDDFPFMTSKTVEIGRVRCKAIRVSYSGELGWELHCPMANQKALFDTLMAKGQHHGLILVGSRAMGMLRLEKGYRSWGAEMSTEITPHAAGLERFCSQHKDFLGRAAVVAERNAPPAQRLATLAVDTAAPPCWGTEPVLHGDELVGYVTSGGMGWRVDTLLAVAWLDAAYANPGTELSVQILQRAFRATVVADPVYDPGDQRLKG
ncbi:MAG: aminomethyltransferase family protein, partial [Pseudomonadota bacterium]